MNEDDLRGGQARPAEGRADLTVPDAGLEETVDTLDAQLAVRRTAFARGDKLAHFIVVDLLGEGGMGTVVSAYDPDLDRKVAIKVLRGDLHHDGDEPSAGQQRLMREAQAMARLSHPNVVAVHEVGTVDDRVFIAMEFVDGPTLGTWLEAERRSWREVVAAYVQAGHGLASAHAAGLVHRDFKPDNVMVRKDGRVVVTDFGLAAASAGLAAEGSGSEPGGPQAATAVTPPESGGCRGAATLTPPEPGEAGGRQP